MDAVNPNVRRWDPQTRREPTIRIGVILDEDAAARVRLTLPQAAYGIEGFDPDSGGRNAPQAPQAVESGAAIDVQRSDNGLSLQIGGKALRGRAARIEPLEPRPLTAASGVLVNDVVAGRGFHWQRRIDQSLSGALELRCSGQGIVLINELLLEEYLAGVITAEMGSACPLEFLKAQCIVARSWLLAMTEEKHPEQPFDRCNDDCCQRYQGTSDLGDSAMRAVEDTRGRLLLHARGGVLDANYSKCCGGVSELPLAVWGFEKPGIKAIVDAPQDDPARRFYPVTDQNLDEFIDGGWRDATNCYCSPRVVPVDAVGRYLGRVDTVDDYFRWTARYQRGELEALLRASLSDPHELGELRDLRVRARGVSGRAYAVESEWLDEHGNVVRRRIDTEYQIRKKLHRGFLYSSAFAVRCERDSSGGLRTVTLRGAGWGHGVGLCQMGALGMALVGHDCDAICRHYYPAATLAQAY